MAERTVAVRLLLNAQGYMQGMDAVKRKTAEGGSEVEKLALKRESFTALGTAAIGFGAAAALGVGVAISKFAEFDQQMSYVQASTHETAGNMALLRDAALDAGARTVFSATEAAGAIEELAKAGVSTADILSGGLDAALDLAAAGGLGVADAAGIAATALKTFNLQGEDMSHVADLLAAGAGKAMGDVTELSAALAQGGLVAKATGLTIEETTAGLAAFAAEGLRGSDAGTAFKSMLQRLTPQSAEAQSRMDELGISAYDASGEFIGLAEFAGNLQGALKSLTPEQRNSAMATIFGADAVRAANVLYEQGEKGINDWTDAVNDQGYAAQTAAMRLDNLKGDLEALGGAFDTALIQSGSGANDALRSLVQIATGAVDVFNGFPEPLQQSAVYLGLAAAGVGLVGGAALLATPRVIEFKATVQNAGLSMRGLALAAGGVTFGLAAVIGIVAAVASAQAEAQAKAESYADTLEDGTRRITEATRDMIATNLTADKAFLWLSEGSTADAAEELGLSLDTVAKAAEGNAAALREVNEVIKVGLDEGMKPMKDANLEAYDAAIKLKGGLEAEIGALDKAAEVAEQRNEITEAGTDITQTSAEAYMAAADEVSDLNSELAQLIETINAANGVGQDAVSTNARYQGALAGISEEVQSQKDAYEEANETLDGFNLSLDQNTASGSANAAMLADVAGAAQTAAEAQFEQDQMTMTADEAAKKYNETLGAQRQAFIDSATQAGFNADEVKALADEVFALPNEKAIEILADTAGAQWTIDQFLAANASKRVTIAVGAGGSGGQVVGNFTGNLYERGKVKEFRAGGFASGFYQGEVHKFAEKHLPWELYVSPDPAYREQNKALIWEGGSRLGMWESAPAQYGQVAVSAPAQPSFPERITLVDADGSILTHARVIADHSAASATSHLTAPFRGGRRR